MLEEHIGYLGDGRRTVLYRAAIGAAVKPGDVVADLGCGSGVLGLLALQAGAGRVYAIDSGSIVHVAAETFRRAGFADRATVLRSTTYRTVLPEPVDVLLCDHVGFFGFDYSILRLLDDGRRRFLKPGGHIVPQQLDIAIAPVDAPAAWDKANAWRSAAVPPDFAWVGEASLNSKHPADLKSEALLAPPATVARLNLHDSAPGFFALRAVFQAMRGGSLHGIAGFFDCDLHAAIRMTNAPGAPGAIARHQAFLPFSEPIAVAAGDEIAVSVSARPEDDLLAWEVRLPRTGQRLRQSSIQSLLLSPQDIARRQSDYRPRPSAEAAARMLVLTLCDGTRTSAAIAEEVLKNHPELMPSPAELRHFVSRVIEQDTR